MQINSILLAPKDSVITSLKLIEKESDVVYKYMEDMVSIKTLDNIPSYHKVAIKNISKGDYIIKYGEIIGIATKDIKTGQHVNDLNIDSVPREYYKELVAMES